MPTLGFKYSAPEELEISAESPGISYAPLKYETAKPVIEASNYSLPRETVFFDAIDRLNRQPEPGIKKVMQHGVLIEVVECCT